PTFRPMASIAAWFGLQKLPPEKARALSIVYATSVALMMGVNFIQPALPALTLAFHVSDAELSWVMTVFTAPAIFLSPVFGVIADRHGRRLLLAFGMFAFGLFGAAMAFAPNYTWLLVFRALQGVGFSAVIPLTIVLIGDLLEGDKEIGGQGFKVFLDRIGYLVFPPLGGLLATIAWFWPFIFYLLTIPVGVAALAWMPETKGKSSQRTMTYLGDMLRLARHPRLVIAFSAGFLRFFLDYGFLTYFPLFLVRTHGISMATAGLLYIFFSVGAMVTSSQAGRIAAGAVRRQCLADRRRAVFLWPGQRRDLADAEKFIDAERAGGTARRHRLLRPFDPTGRENDFDFHRRTVVSERGVADDFLDVGDSLVYQRRLNGLPVAAGPENPNDPDVYILTIHRSV
ncbi:MAG: transporter, partial [Deltaproteobacteria bacterium]|nr:transporter [Deltaproteobacteria bacterium]